MHEEIKTAFDQIKAEEQLKQKTKNYIESQYLKHSKIKSFLKRRYVSLACTCVILFCGVIGYHFYFTPTSVISIDINPSIELEVNCFDQVISAKGYNDDGKKLLKSLSIEYTDYDHAIDAIMESQTIQDCMKNNEYLSIAVVNISSQQSEEIIRYVNDCHYYDNSDCYSLTMDDVEEAHEMGLSYGKYQLYQQIKAVNDDITAEEIQNMSMKEIRLLMEQLGLSVDHHNESQQSNQNQQQIQTQTGTGNNESVGKQKHHQHSHH